MAQASTIKPSPELPRAAKLPRSAVRFAMLSDPGRIRSINEDNCGACPDQNAFVVCDGMGGAASGELASEIARDSFLNSIMTSAFTATPARARLYEAVRAANQSVYRQAQRSRIHKGMGTTLVSILLEAAIENTEPAALIAHVGDSRCYRLRSGRLEPLTRDHSLVQEQIQAGLISAGDAANSPVRNIITRAVGTYPSVEIDITAHTLQPGDLFLLASDGLTTEVSDEEIAATLRKVDLASGGQAALDGACQALIGAANEHGGADNITVLLVAIP